MSHGICHNIGISISGSNWTFVLVGMTTNAMTIFSLHVLRKHFFLRYFTRGKKNNHWKKFWHTASIFCSNVQYQQWGKHAQTVGDRLTYSLLLEYWWNNKSKKSHWYFLGKYNKTLLAQTSRGQGKDFELSVILS